MMEESRHREYVMAGFSIIAKALVSGDVTLSVKTASTDTSEVLCMIWLIAIVGCRQAGCMHSFCMQLVPLLLVLKTDIYTSYSSHSSFYNEIHTNPYMKV